LTECDSGRHPRARNAQLPTQPQWEKRAGSAFPEASVAVRLYVRRTSDLAQPSELHSVQLAGFRRVDWQVNKRLQGRIEYHIDASVSSLSLRRVPKLLTGSARVMLTEGNFRQRRFSSCIGCLDCGRSPSNGSANRRSLAFGSIEKEAEVALIPQERPVRTSLNSSSTLVKRIGAPIFTVDSVDSTVAICPLHLGVRGTDVHPRMGAGLLEAATVLAVIPTAGVACTPKLCAAFRLKTFEARPDARYGPVRGKTATRTLCPSRVFVLLGQRRNQRTTGVWCRWVQTLWVCFRRPDNGYAILP